MVNNDDIFSGDSGGPTGAWHGEHRASRRSPVLVPSLQAVSSLVCPSRPPGSRWHPRHRSSAYGSGTASPPLRPLALASSNLAGNALLGTTALMIREYGNTVTCMKATIELPDALVIQAKKRAAELRRPLRSLVESGLRAELRRSRAKRDTRKEPVELDWITVDGGLPPDVDISDRAAMHEWIRRQS